MSNIEDFLKQFEELLSKYRRTIVWLGVAVVLLMILYPPWVFEVSRSGAVIRVEEQYSLLFYPPDIQYHIDLTRLFLQSMPIIIIIIAALWVSRSK